MAHDSMCSKCRNPLSFKPRVNVAPTSVGPSMSSSLEMQEILFLCDEDLDDYDAEIICLQNQVINLQEQRNQLSDYKTQLQSSVSPDDLSHPFWKLPNEILCIIFESICAENLLQEYLWLPNNSLPTCIPLPAITYLPSLAISAVCTRWRSLALASPGLWSQLRLETGRSKKPLDDGFVSTLRLFLDRSADAPLSINVTTQGRISLYKNRNSSALSLLLNHADRWKTFSYTGDYDLEELLGFDRSFPILENLTLIGDRLEITSNDMGCFEKAPKLLIVTTRGHIIALPRLWNHLTSLQILMPPTEEDICSLQSFPYLTDLKLSSPLDGFGTGIISLAKLESFTFVESPHVQKDNMLSDMFSVMTFPSLTELVIDSKNDSKYVRPRLNWPPDAFSAFISRSTCILTTLSLRLVWISDRSLITAFHILPSLVRFSIDDFLDPHREEESPITPHFISCMSASSLNPVLPKLHSLSITTYNASFDDIAFVNMVSSRWLPGSSAAAIGVDCLRSLVLHLPTREVDEEIYRPLENLDRMGMRVVVTGKCVTGTNTS